MNPYQSFETERLLLLPTSLEDASFLLELLNTPKWLKYIGDRNVHTLEEAEDYIKARILPQLERLGYANYTVVRKSDHVKMGSCGIYDRVGLEGVDIGFAFLPSYEKQGYAFEAANKIKEAGFGIFNLKKISAITSKENFDSQKLLEKLGFQFSKMTQLSNEGETLMLYEIRV